MQQNHSLMSGSYQTHSQDRLVVLDLTLLHTPGLGVSNHIYGGQPRLEYEGDGEERAGSGE